MQETSGDGVGRLCEASGADVIINQMFSTLRKGGHVVMVGLPRKPIHLENPLPDIGEWYEQYQMVSELCSCVCVYVPHTAPYVGTMGGQLVYQSRS